MSERHEQRVDLALGVVLRHQGTSEPCLTRNLSSHGMLVGARKRWPVGTLLDIEIIHEGRRISAQARVASHLKSGLGLEFVGDGEGGGPQRAVEEIISRFVPQGQGEGHVPVADPLRSLLVSWAVAPEGKWWRVWYNRWRRTRFIDVSLDGASLVSKTQPPMGALVVLRLPPLASLLPPALDRAVDLAIGLPAPRTALTCRANVVRHTEHGFALRFVSPSGVFRHAISEIRKAMRGRRDKGL